MSEYKNYESLLINLVEAHLDSTNAMLAHNLPFYYQWVINDVYTVDPAGTPVVNIDIRAETNASSDQVGQNFDIIRPIWTRFLNDIEDDTYSTWGASEQSRQVEAAGGTFHFAFSSFVHENGFTLRWRVIQPNPWPYYQPSRQASFPTQWNSQRQGLPKI